MIRITVELVPHGIESQKRVIASAKIWNDGTGTRTRGNYKWYLWGKRTMSWKNGEVKNFPRLQKNVWFLIWECLKDL